MATEYKIIKIRGGLGATFVPSSLLPRELWISTDTGEAFFCYAAGKYKQFATFEDMVVFIKNANAEIVLELKNGVEKAINDAELATNNAQSIHNTLVTMLENGDFKGDQGIQGAQGPQGAQGVKGQKGEKGEQGPIGLQGLKGDNGAQGIAGAQGIQGLQGVKGDTGLQGIQGLKGNAGIKGAQGIQGPKGDKGDTGTNGVVTQMQGMYVFKVENGHLYVVYPDAALDPPPFSIDASGHLIAMIGE